MSAAQGPLLAVRDLVQEFEVRGRGGVRAGVVQAVSSVSFDVQPDPKGGWLMSVAPMSFAPWLPT